MKNIEFKPFTHTDGFVTAYLHTPLPLDDRITPSDYSYPSIIICPGGGYEFVSAREADPVALEYLSAGYNVFILTYSVGEKAKDFVPLMELSQTVMTIREHADEWGCIPSKIAVCGFSAGGHLACSLSTLWNHPELLKRMNTDNGKNRPNAAILSYPVILANEYAHEGSITRVSGSPKGSGDYLFFSLDKQVSIDTCETFLWHTANDTCVPVENSLYFALALQEHKIPYECHIYPEGTHGLSVCTNETRSEHDHNRQWVEASKKWLNNLFHNKL
ncbi:MAG: alpha/beta hydrolase [Eubacteriales bacterium]